MASSSNKEKLSRPGRWVVSKFGGPDVLRWERFSALPVPTRDTARIRILISGIGGADNNMRAGGYTRNPLAAAPGFTPGYEIVGVIEAFGDGTQDRRGFAIGDVVASLCVVGGYGTHTIVLVDEMLKLRKDDDLVSVGALTLNYMTAYGMLTKSAFPVMEATEWVLIGSVAGGVGTALAQLIKVLYPQVKMIGTCSTEKFEFVESLGVAPVDRRMPPRKLSAAIKQLTGGQGVDIAYEMAGSSANLEAFIGSTNETGKLIAIGFLANVKADGSGIASETFDPLKWCSDRSEKASFFSVTNHYWKGQRAVFKKDFEDVLLSLVRSKRLAPLVTKLWRLEDAVEINEMLATGKGLVGKHEMVVDDPVWKEYSESRES